MFGCAVGGYDVRHKADYSHLNRRGQYGSVTAKAFVADIKESFLKAVGRLYIERYPRDAQRQLQEQSAGVDG